MPDFSAAVTGPDVTPQFAGGYSLTGIVDQFGEVQFYGGAVSGGPLTVKPGRRRR